MNNQQLKLLAKMKRLIKEGKRSFLIREDRDYAKDISQIGISEPDAWEIIYRLTPYDYIVDYKPVYRKENSEALTFKKIINGEYIYIKLRIMKLNDEEETVCFSFHIDYK